MNQEPRGTSLTFTQAIYQKIKAVKKLKNLKYAQVQLNPPI